MEPEVVADYQCVLGEGPLWHPVEQQLYWTDINTGRIFRYDPVTGKHEQYYQGRPVGGFTFQAHGGLLLFMEDGTIIDWQQTTQTTLVEQIAQEVGNRFNDVITDPLGRVFCGTLSPAGHSGRLYRLDRDATLHEVYAHAGLSNGMGFSLDERYLYHIDSNVREIARFPYDATTGAIGARELFARSRPDDGLPDGMTVDEAGYLWVAQWDGSCVLRYTPTGAIDRRYSFPTGKITSVAFGGIHLDELYVTSAGGLNRSATDQFAGALFRLKVGVRGRPEYLSRVGKRPNVL